MAVIQGGANADARIDAADDLETLEKRSGRESISVNSVLTPGTTLSDGRLSIVRRLGHGGMGVVYEAFDTRRGHRVALKVLSEAGADSVYRLKNEFRALEQTRHSNLVTLYELWCDATLWCFTMELVEGWPFDQWVRSDAHGHALDRADDARLRHALPQLLDAVAAMHEAGKLHRDLKPSNVLVTDEGRLVVLDFGLVVDPEPGGVGQTIPEVGVNGTPQYMAPEQAAGQPAVEASDVYAVGSMLFEALTGRLPFEGPAGAILAAKQYDDAPRAGALASHVPVDLDALCTRLLARDPAARPSARALRAEMEPAVPALAHVHLPARARRSTGAASDAAAPALFGREQALSQLRDAFDVALSGRPVVVFVSGESGIGKSALCEAFLREASVGRGATVLAGRCNERENVPFKGFDSLVDDLSRHLRRLPRVEVEALLPRDVSLLPRLFPVLDRIEAIAQAPRKVIPDPQELRRCAFAAFGELIARIRDRVPLCLHIDDAQWLDTDSMLFMRSLLLQGDPAPWLWLVSHRSEDADQHAALHRVRDAIEGNRQVQQRTLTLGPLSESAAQELAATLLPPRESHADVTRLIARESGGSPLFVDELVRYLTRHAVDLRERDGFSLAAALADHVAALPLDVRRLLEQVALAGRPLRADVVLHASATSHDALDLLRAAHLLRSSSVDGNALVECYHDKVRETVCAGLSESQRIECSAALAAALEPHPDADPELLARCFEVAGQLHQAASYTARAAEAAMRGMAFMHAARLYAHALGFDTWSASERRALSIAQGDALAHAGSGKQAAAAYLRAADDSSAIERLELQRRAAEQLQTTGYVDEGTALFAQLFRELGLTLPMGTGAAFRHLLVSELRLRFRGMKFQRRHAREVPAAIHFKLVTMRAAIDGISAHAPLVAASLLNDYVCIALDAGDSEYVAEGLVSLAYFASFANPNAGKRIDKLMALADSVAERRADAALVGRMEMIRGAVAVNRGQWTVGRAHEARAIASLQSAGPGITWVLDGARIYDQIGAFCLGDFRSIAANTRALAEEGLSLDRVWVAAMLCGALGSPAWLCSGDDAGFERMLGAVGSRWQPQAEALWPDYNLALGEVALRMYRGEAGAAHAACERAWPALKRSLVTRAEIALGVGGYFRGTAAVGALRSASGSDTRRALSVARDSVRRLRGVRLAAAPAWRAVIQAGLALHARQTTEAAVQMRAAIVEFDRNGMAMFTAAVSRRLGELIGGSSGAELLAAANAAMHEQGVTDLDAMTEVLCGGCRASVGG